MVKLLDYILTPRGMIMFTLWIIGAMVVTGVIASGYANPLIERAKPLIQSMMPQSDSSSDTAEAEEPSENLNALRQAAEILENANGEAEKIGDITAADIKDNPLAIMRNFNAIKEEIENQGAYYVDPDTGQRIYDFTQEDLVRYKNKEVVSESAETETAEETQISEQKSRLGFKSVNQNNEGEKKFFKSVESSKEKSGFKSVGE